MMMFHGGPIRAIVSGSPPVAPYRYGDADDAEISALCVAIGNSVGFKMEGSLVSLLRKLAPGHPLLSSLDRLAVEYMKDVP